MKGGSYASDDVTGAVTAKAFTRLDNYFTNELAQKGGKKGVKTGKKTKPTTKCARCPHCGGSYRMKGGEGEQGEVIPPETVSEAFQQPSPFKSQAAPFKGGNKKSDIRNINDLMKRGKFTVFNKRGGANDTPITIGLKSNAAIIASSKPNGVAPMRVPDSTTLNILANENLTGPMALNKFVRYGDVTGSVQSDSVFKYGGAWKKVVAAKKKVVAPKKKAVAPKKKIPSSKKH